MLIEKLKIPAAILMMTAVLGTGAGVSVYRAGAQESEIAASDTESKPQPPSKAEKPRKSVAAPAEQPKDEKIKIRTTNFLVTAPTVEIGEQIGVAAEHNRKALALLWLNKELPDWAEPCPIRVTITSKTINSSSEFQFQDAPVASKERVIVKDKTRIVKRGGMILEGPLDRILADLLPHEVTHTILAEWRGDPLPRWADEGAAMLSESAIGRATHERAMERLLRSGHLLPLRDLLPMGSYPKEVTAFYAQSLSLTDLLVTLGGRKRFLAFVAQGERDGWDIAVKARYDFERVEVLEQTWLEHLRERLATTFVLPSERGQGGAYQPTPRESVPVVTFKRRLPAGPAPIQVLAALGENGVLLVCRKISSCQPVTSEVVLEDGRRQRFTRYLTKHQDVAAAYDSAEIRVHDTKGRAIDMKELRKRLKGETLVLVSANGRPVDPLHLRLYKEDMLVFVLPPQTLRAVPGRDPMAPTAVPAMPPPGVPVPPSVAPPPRVGDSEERVPPPGS